MLYTVALGLSAAIVLSWIAIGLGFVVLYVIAWAIYALTGYDWIPALKIAPKAPPQAVYRRDYRGT